MSESITNDVFALALAKRKQAEQEAEEAKKNKGQGSFDYEETQAFPLQINAELDKAKVFRILGKPIEYRNESTDPKLILQSKIVNEARTGYVNINWPVVINAGKIEPDPDWILTKLYNTVNESYWQKYTEEDVDGVKVKFEGDKIKNAKGYNGYYINKHEGTQIYSYVKENCRKTNDKFPKFFYPSKRVVMNVIDRHDDWCKNNKHAKLLISKLGMSTKKDEKGVDKTAYFPEVGIPESLYAELLEHLVKSKGHWDTDAIVYRIKDKPYYKVWDATDAEKYIGEVGKALAKDEPLTDEEKSYELYDLDHLYPVASYRKLLKKLGFLFKLCDAEIGTKLYDELEKLASKEAEEQAHEEKEEADEVEEETTTTETNSAPARRAVTKEDSISTSNKDILDCFAKVYPKFTELSEDDKKIMIDSVESINKETGLPVFKDSSKPALCTDENCKFAGTNIDTEMPEAVSQCPSCGRKFS